MDKALELRVSCGKQFLNEFLAEFNSSKKIFLSELLDILGCGGFAITNFQSELLDYFEDGNDLVIYENEEDLHNKIRYYLQHDDERKQIAINGYKKVKEFHNYGIRVNEILKTVFGM
ncbi:MAG: glycosyltransferase family 1 protein [Clostridiales bacterium]|nr:glycosyltransferase family 1 protein [Clostridiales bacterium]